MVITGSDAATRAEAGSLVRSGSAATLSCAPGCEERAVVSPSFPGFPACAHAFASDKVPRANPAIKKVLIVIITIFFSRQPTFTKVGRWYQAICSASSADTHMEDAEV